MPLVDWTPEQAEKWRVWADANPSLADQFGITRLLRQLAATTEQKAEQQLRAERKAAAQEIEEWALKNPAAARRIGLGPTLEAARARYGR
ncbi:MAG: hypothetical protein U0Y82_16775 [Thermoleophilia bacterium]